jgi:hypothetical protein
MASTPFESGESGASGPPGAEQPAVKRTRRTDGWTDAFLVLTAVFGVWAASLVVLTTLAIVRPTLLYEDQKTALKAAGATVVGLIALLQVYTMNAAMGKFPTFGIRMKYLMRSHRYAGRTALLLAAVLAFFCMTDIGAPQSPLTSALHGIFGSTAFLAIAVKLGLLKWRPRVAYDVAPWLGRYAAFAFVVVWITSVLAFYTDIL